MSKTVGLVSDPFANPVFWGGMIVEGPDHVRHGSQDYWLWKVWGKESDHPDARKIWAGFSMRGPFGETAHQAAEDTQPNTVLAMHLNSPVVQSNTKGLRGQLASLKFEEIPTEVTHDVGLVAIHGVATNGTVVGAIYPKGSNLLDSLARRDVYLVTDENHIIDVAAHVWPIDLKAARDFRTKILAPVRYGDRLGVVSGLMGDFVILKSNPQEIVEYRDLDPVMVEQAYRQLI